MFTFLCYAFAVAVGFTFGYGLCAILTIDRLGRDE